MKIIHPNPIVEQFKVILFAVIISILIWLVRDYFPNLYVSAILLTWLVAIIAVGFFWLVEQFTTLEIGDDGLFYKKGILSRKTVLVPYKMVTDTRYSQALVERIFGTGTLEIDTAADDSVSILMHNVHYRDADEIMGNVKSRHGGGIK